jgi:uncharacterized protein
VLREVEPVLKPTNTVDRDHEWSQLDGFLAGPDEKLRIGVVSGRRRVGKSFLLRAACEAVDGLYLTAVAEEGRAAAQRRFADGLARYAGVSPELISVDSASWQGLLENALDLLAARHGRAGLLVLDELPYWLAHSPEIPGLLQLLYDRSQGGERITGRIVLCGSAMSVMTELLSGTKALRGRAALDLKLGPFDFRDMAGYWSIADPGAALRMHAVLGGAPGYRNLANVPAPQSVEDFDQWVTGTVLDRGQALFSRAESEYLLREDPRFSGSSLHYSILGAVAAGATTPSKIGGLIGTDRTALTRPLDALTAAHYLRTEHDLLWQRKPTITIADPIVRFHHLITVPQNDLIEVGDARLAWQAARASFDSRILGPHFEQIARDWTRRYAAGEALAGIHPGIVGSTAVHDRSGRAQIEVDVLALDPVHRPTGGKARISLIGEAKATVTRRGTSDLARLDKIRDTLAEQGHDADEAVLALYGLSGFYPDLVETARERGDVLLVDLDALYGKSSPSVVPVPRS